MKLLILVSCFCLQLASAPAAKAFCPAGPASLKAPDSDKVEALALTAVFIESQAPDPIVFFAGSFDFPAGSFPSFASAKNFLIHTGLSPPLVIG